MNTHLKSVSHSEVGFVVVLPDGDEFFTLSHQTAVERVGGGFNPFDAMRGEVEVNGAKVRGCRVE